MLHLIQIGFYKGEKIETIKAKCVIIFDEKIYCLIGRNYNNLKLIFMEIPKIY